MQSKVKCTCHNKMQDADKVVKFVICKDDLITDLLTGYGRDKSEERITLEDWYEKNVRGAGR